MLKWNYTECLVIIYSPIKFRDFVISLWNCSLYITMLTVITYFYLLYSRITFLWWYVKISGCKKMPNVHCGDHLLPWETLSGLGCLSSGWHTGNQCFWQGTEHGLKKTGQKYWSRRTPKKKWHRENGEVGGNPKRKVTERLLELKFKETVGGQQPQCGTGMKRRH